MLYNIEYLVDMCKLEWTRLHLVTGLELTGILDRERNREHVHERNASLSPSPRLLPTIASFDH